MTPLAREVEAEGRGDALEARASTRRLAIVIAATVGVALVLHAMLGEPSRAAGPSPSSSFEAGPSDHRLLLTTMATLGYPVERLQRSYASLTDPTTTVLVTIDPSAPADLRRDPSAALDDHQRRALRRFVEAGGTWLVTARGYRPLRIWGVELDPGEDSGFAADDLIHALGRPPELIDVDARGDLRGLGPIRDLHGWLAVPAERAAGVRRMLAPPAKPEAGAPARLRAFADQIDADWQPRLTLDRQPLVLERAIGSGRLILCSTALPFTNLGLARLDTAPIAVRLLHDASDAGRRSLLFDEFAHGHVEARGIWWWARERGLLHGLLAGLVLLAVAGWRSAVPARSTSAPDDRPRRAVEEFVVAQAGLAARAGDHRRALEHLRRALVGSARRRGDGDALRRLAATAATLDGTPARQPDAAATVAMAQALASAAETREDPATGATPP